jgi:hypothetical protein
MGPHAHSGGAPTTASFSCCFFDFLYYDGSALAARKTDAFIGELREQTEQIAPRPLLPEIGRMVVGLAGVSFARGLGRGRRRGPGAGLWNFGSGDRT